MDETPSDQFEDMKEKIGRILRYKMPIYVMNTFEENEDTFLDMAEAFIRVNRFGVRIGNLELMLSFLAGAISGDYSGPRNLDSVISYTWDTKRGGPSGANAQEVSAFI